AIVSCNRSIPPQNVSLPNVSKWKMRRPSLTIAAAWSRIWASFPLSDSSGSSPYAVITPKTRIKPADVSCQCLMSTPPAKLSRLWRTGDENLLCNLSSLVDSVFSRGTADPMLAEAIARLSDEEIVKRVLDGDTALFELIVRRYNQRLFRTTR